MSVKYALVGIFMLFTFQTFAQEKEDESDVTFDIHAGMAFTNFHVDYGSNKNVTTKTNTSITGGAGIRFRISDKIGIKTGLDYSLLGSTISGALFNQVFTKDVDINLPYLSMPFLFDYKILHGLAVVIGPQYGVLLSAKYHVKDGSDFSVKNQFNSSAWTGVGGLEYTFKVGKNTFYISPKYNLGLSNIIKNTSNNSSNNFYNKGYTFTVGYHL